MKSFWNEHVLNLDPYKVSSHSAWEHFRDPDILKLDWNEATANPPKPVMDDMKSYLNYGRLNWYPDINNVVLREEIAKYADIGSTNIDYFSGSDAVHEYVLRGLLSPGKKVAVISPTYDNFRVVAASCGAEVVHFNLLAKDNFNLSLSHLSDFILHETPDLVYVCNPNNPTGTIIEIDEVEQLLINYPNSIFIIDEAYYEFFGVSSASLTNSYKNILITRTFSKAFGLAALRMGYVISHEENIKILSKIRNPKNIVGISQVAALSALKNINLINSEINEIKASKKYFLDELNKIQQIKLFNNYGGNYCLMDVGQAKNKLLDFLENNKIYIRNLSHEELKNCVRITIGSTEQMKKVVDVLRKFYSSL
jgi:histidinol-phosphate aminotransferase